MTHTQHDPLLRRQDLRGASPLHYYCYHHYYYHYYCYYYEYGQWTDAIDRSINRLIEWDLQVRPLHYYYHHYEYGQWTDAIDRSINRLMNGTGRYVPYIIIIIIIMSTDNGLTPSIDRSIDRLNGTCRYVPLHYYYYHYYYYYYEYGQWTDAIIDRSINRLNGT